MGAILSAFSVGCADEARQLDGPVIPRSGEVVDCKGGAIHASTPWDPNTDDESDIAVIPGVFLHDVDGVTIRDCTIEGFEISILAVGGAQHHIVDNVLDSRGVAVWLEGAVDVELSGNEIRASDRGIYVTRGADRARIVDNTLSTDQPGARAIMVVDPFEAVHNYLVGDILAQAPNAVGPVEGTLIEDNDITGAGLYLALRSKDSIARNNRLTGMQEAVRLPGGADGGRINLPGTCSGDASRYCAGDEDCFIDAVDATPLGSCVFVGPAQCSDSQNACMTADDCPPGDTCEYQVEDDLRVQSTRVSANEISDVCVGFTLGFTPDAVIDGNTLSGRAAAGTCAVGQGIAIANASSFTITVRDNSIRDFDVGLVIQASGASEFAARVYHNDIVGNALDYGTGNWFPSVLTEQLELSYEGEGNYWGYPCDAPTTAFPSRSVCRGGELFWSTCTEDAECPGSYCAALPFVDSHPYGASVAESTTPCTQ